MLLDEARLRQVIFNLLGNAVKFTHEGKVELRVGCRSKPDAPDRIDLRIEVSDTGIGIGREDQKTIFEPFEQSPGQKQKVYGGTGLGLSITSRLIGMMGGSLNLSSAPGRGSSFVIELTGVTALPAENVSAPAGSGTAEGGVPDPGFPGVSAFVVDDNLLNRRVLSASLRSRGIEVREAEDGAEFLRKFDEVRPDIVFMDLQMPGLSGEDTVLRLRERNGNLPVPVIACTALDPERARGIAKRAGIEEILFKPISRVRSPEYWSVSDRLPVVPPRFLRRRGRADGGADPGYRSRPPGRIDRVAGVRTTRRLGPSSQHIRIAPITGAADAIKKAGVEYQVPPLVAYAGELHHWINLFDVAKLKESMAAFPRIVENLRGEPVGEAAR